MSSNVDAVAAEHDLQAGDVGALGLRQLVDVALEEIDVASRIERDRARGRLRSGPSRSSGRCAAARSSGRPGRSRRCPAGAPPPITPRRNVAVVVDGRRLRSRHRAPACRTRSRRLRTPDRPGTRRPGCGAVAEDQLGVGADVHDRDQPVLVREIDRQHARRRVGADVAADDRRAVDARLRMDRQQAAAAGLRSGWSWSACPPPFRSR